MSKNKLKRVVKGATRFLNSYGTIILVIIIITLLILSITLLFENSRIANENARLREEKGEKELQIKTNMEEGILDDLVDEQLEDITSETEQLMYTEDDARAFVRRISLQIEADSQIKAIDDCHNELTNPNFADFGITYNSCELELSPFKGDDYLSNYEPAIGYNLVDIGTGEKAIIGIYIPGPIGWGGPANCFKNSNYIFVKEGIYRGVHEREEGSKKYFYTNLVSEIGDPEFDEVIEYIESFENSETFFLESEKNRIPVDKSEVRFCEDIGPDLATKNTLNKAYADQLPEGEVWDPNIQIALISISTESSDQNFLQKLDEVVKTLKQ